MLFTNFFIVGFVFEYEFFQVLEIDLFYIVWLVLNFFHVFEIDFAVNSLVFDTYLSFLDFLRVSYACFIASYRDLSASFSFSFLMIDQNVSVTFEIYQLLFGDVFSDVNAECFFYFEKPAHVWYFLPFPSGEVSILRVYTVPPHNTSLTLT